MKKVLLLLLTHFTLPILAQSSFLTVPAKIQAENYVELHGGSAAPGTDTDGGSELSWLPDSSWASYSISVSGGKYYNFQFRVANGFSENATLQVESSTGSILKEIRVPQTGGMQSWKTIQTLIPLSSGNQTIKIVAHKGVFSLNWFEISESEKSLPGKIEAENYDLAHEVQTETTSDIDGVLNVGYIDDNDWLDYNVTVSSADSYKFSFRIANSYGSGVIQIKNADGVVLGSVDVPQTGGWQNWSTISTTLDLPAGNQLLRIYALKGAFNFNWFEVKKESLLAPELSAQISYYPIPSKIEAEDNHFNSGLGTGATNDAGGGLEVGWIPDNSWLAYGVSSSSSQFYTLRFRVANAFSENALIQITDSSNVVLQEIAVPQTGGMQNFQTISTLLHLPSGNFLIKVVAKRGVFSLNWLEVIKSDKVIPSRIEAESYDVAQGVQTEQTSDIDGNQNVGYIDDNDWLDYNVTVPVAGNYLFSFRVANSYGNGLIEIKDKTGAILSDVSVSQTGGWQNWATINTTAQLSAGNQVIRIYAKRGAFNFNWLQIVEAASVSPSVITFENLPAKTLGAAPFQLVASSTNNESEIVFSSSNTNIVTVTKVSSQWIATLVSEGTATITASQSGSTYFSSATPVSVTVTVNPAPLVELGQKIALDPKRWYQVNNATRGLDALFDGNTQENVNTGWGKALDIYDAYYPLKEGEKITLRGLKMFDYEGQFTEKPMILSVITDQWERIPYATFTGSIYNGWVGPYPDREAIGQANYLLDSPLSNIRYLVLTIQSGMPTEMEFYGDYTPPTKQETPVPAKAVKLGDMFGVNAYEWNFQDGETPWLINETKMEMAKSFTGIRHYMDWEKLEIQEGLYSFSPTLSGGWHYDDIYERCKEAGIEVLACLKTLPNWMQATYPEHQRDSEWVPVRYGKDFSDPLSYIEQARIGFQYAARYGSNTAVDSSLLSVHQEMRWPGDNPNRLRIGTGLVKYIECDNERDKWWKGRLGYQSAREYAANLSAFYDGHLNTMGPAIGIKNADPNMKVVIAGLVTGPDYIKGMVDWCKEFRGYKPDGTVNLCWDVINFHLYTDNTSSSQSGTSTRGASPEMTNADQILNEFVTTSHQLCYDMPVWITETGFDIHQDSPLKAIPIGNKSALDTQADWILRTSLFAARNKIDKVFFYQICDDNTSGGIFSTSGLVNWDLTRRPSAEFLLQTNKLFGSYLYQETLNTDPFIDRYELEGKSMFVAVVPDIIGRTASYSLNIGNYSEAEIYVPVAGSTNMSKQMVPVVNGHVALTVTETPQFIVPKSTANARVSSNYLPELLLTEESTSVSVYPNPSSDFVHITSPATNSSLEINLFNAGSGNLYKNVKTTRKNSDPAYKLDISNLPTGSYILEIKQDNNHWFKKIVKL